MKDSLKNVLMSSARAQVKYVNSSHIFFKVFMLMMLLVSLVKTEIIVLVVI